MINSTTTTTNESLNYSFLLVTHMVFADQQINNKKIKIKFKIKPSHILSLLLQGLTYYQHQEIQLAKTNFRQAIALTPQNREEWQARGIALDKLERYVEALTAYDKAIEIKQDCDRVWYNRGLTLFNLGRYEEAVASYEKAMEINQDCELTRYARVKTLCNLVSF